MIINQPGNELLMDPESTYVLDIDWSRITDIDFSKCDTLKDLDKVLP